MHNPLQYTREQTFDWGSILWFTEPVELDTERISVGLATYAPGMRHRTRMHSGEEQVLYVVAGTGTHFIDGREQALVPGRVVRIPPHTEHELINTAETDLKILLMYSPLRMPPLLSPEQPADRPTPGTDTPRGVIPAFFRPGDVDAIREVMEGLSRALGLSLALLDTRGMCVVKTPNHPIFCSCLAEQTGGHYCRNHLLSIFEELNDLHLDALGKPHLFYCCHNIASTIIPVVYDQKIQAYMKCGEIFLSNTDKEHLHTELPMIAERCNVAVDALAAMVEAIPVEPKSRLYTAAEATLTVAGTIVNMAVAARRQNELNDSKLSLAREQLASAHLEKALREADLKLLQSQVNPHFLFNTLNTIAQTAYIEGAIQSSELTLSLSELLRATLRKTETLIPLHEEVALLRNYIHIQKARFGDRISFSIDVDAAAEPMLIPCLLLQPLVENAIIHGFESLARAGAVSLTAGVHDGRLLVVITDDGVGFDPGMVVMSDPRKIGLRSTQSRLEHYFGGGQRFSVDSTPGRGTRIEIAVPALGGYGRA